MCERCRQPDAVLDADVFALKMQRLVLSVKARTLALGSVKIGDVLQDVLAMVRRHHVRLEGDFVNVVISVLLLEGIGRSLNPDLDLLSSSLPILRQLSAQNAAEMAREGDFSMIMVWMGPRDPALPAGQRRRCESSFPATLPPSLLLSPRPFTHDCFACYRSRDVLSTISFHQIYSRSRGGDRRGTFEGMVRRFGQRQDQGALRVIGGCGCNALCWENGGLGVWFSSLVPGNDSSRSKFSGVYTYTRCLMHNLLRSLSHFSSPYPGTPPHL